MMVVTLEEQSKQVKKKQVISVKVSSETYDKAIQLNKFIKLTTSKGFWGKDQKLLYCNLLLVPRTINYQVILALGKSKSK